MTITLYGHLGDAAIVFTEEDIERAARSLIRDFGERAEQEAMRLAEEAEEAGREIAVQTWQLVIEFLQQVAC